MPIKNARYRYKKGTKQRLAFVKGKVVEVKNMQTGAMHTPAEFAEDRKQQMKHMAKKGRKSTKGSPSFHGEELACGYRKL